MSDTATEPEAPTEPDPPVEEPVDAGRPTCAECGQSFVRKDGLIRHLRSVHGDQARADSHKRSDRRPTSIRVNIGGGSKTGAKPKADPELEAVEARVRQALGLISTLLVVTDGVADATDVMGGADALAGAVKELAKYEEWLKTLAKGGEASERILAWVGVIAASLAILVPILIRHGRLTGPLAEAAVTALRIKDAPAPVAPDGAGAPVAA